MGWVEQGGAWAGAVTAVLILLTMAWRGWRTIRREVIRPVARLTEMVEPLQQMATDWQGEPPRAGVPGRPGVMERLATVEQWQQRHTELHAQPTPVYLPQPPTPAPTAGE